MSSSDRQCRPPAFAQLVERFRQEKQYRRIFDARLMQARLQLDLPLVSQPTFADLATEKQRAYQDAYVRAARETGELFAADGDIVAAWPYFRAVGDTAEIVAAGSVDMGVPDNPSLRIGLARQSTLSRGGAPEKASKLILKHSALPRSPCSERTPRDGPTNRCACSSDRFTQVGDNKTCDLGRRRGLPEAGRSPRQEGRDGSSRTTRSTRTSRTRPVLTFTTD